MSILELSTLGWRGEPGDDLHYDKRALLLSPGIYLSFYLLLRTELGSDSHFVSISFQNLSSITFHFELIELPSQWREVL
jgi:hypothetical protein